MANPEHVEIVRKGGIDFERWRYSHSKFVLDLSNASFEGVNFCKMNLCGTIFQGANLRGARMQYTDLKGSDFIDADLRNVAFTHCDIASSRFKNTQLSCCHFSVSNLTTSRLDLAKFDSTEFFGVNFNRTHLSGADFKNSIISNCSFHTVDLSEPKNLGNAIFKGPSSINLDTLTLSRGKIPKAFLQGCGVPKWMQSFNKLFDPTLSAWDISEVVSTELFDSRTEGPIFMGGVFLSYSHADATFVERLYEKIKSDGISVWLDTHNLNSGNIEKQIKNSIRIQDIVVVVLSKSSLCSDWVWHEIETAREKEQKEGRDVLCPIAIDDAWDSPQKYDNPKLHYMFEEHPIQLRFLKKKNILKFNPARIEQRTYDKLIRGMKTNYKRRKDDDGAIGCRGQ